MIKNTILSLAVILTLSACSQDNAKDTTTQTTDTNTTTQEAVVINGYTLPPVPDKTLNDSTLLGIDSNNNGVRDDVEIYLLKKYKDHHKIVSEIALQSGRASQIILENPENARETQKYSSAALHCNMYFKSSAKSYGDPILIDEYITDYKYEELQLNTKERIRAYIEYNHNLSGGVYRMAGGLERKAKCDFNITELLKVK